MSANVIIKSKGNQGFALLVHLANKYTMQIKGIYRGEITRKSEHMVKARQ